ncbi:hypothetical protein [Streptomyces sp. NPDC002952]|uniref:hypothetical protein n=1 Tax=Streptomyces sp. NPDC002952 TaxID=3364673 RepID=UPI00369F2F20
MNHNLELTPLLTEGRDEHGWATYERTGYATVSCGCGTLDVAKPVAVVETQRIFEEHRD